MNKIEETAGTYEYETRRWAWKEVPPVPMRLVLSGYSYFCFRCNRLLDVHWGGNRYFNIFSATKLICTTCYKK